MPTTANITSTPAAVHTFPKGSTFLIIQNETDTAIRVGLGKRPSMTVTAETGDTGILLPALASLVPGSLLLPLPEPLKKPLPLWAVLTGGGTKVLTVDSIVPPQ